MLVKRKNMLVDNITGELASCDFNPIFDGWTYPDYKKVFNETKQIRFLEAMSAKEFDTEEKLINHIENNLVLAEEKFDGHRALMFITDKGNRFFSKRVSKKSKWLNENSDNVPHLRDFYNLRFNDKRVNPLVGTIIDGEITLPIEDCNSTKVQSVMGALPAKALQYQLDNQFVKLNAFDILYYKGLRVENLPL